MVLIAPVCGHCLPFTWYKKIRKSLEKSKMYAKTSPQNKHINITKITNSQNTKRKYVQPSEQLFPKGGHSATQTELK